MRGGPLPQYGTSHLHDQTSVTNTPPQRGHSGCDITLPCTLFLPARHRKSAANVHGSLLLLPQLRFCPREMRLCEAPLAC